jgi:hypothetical protein
MHCCWCCGDTDAQDGAPLKIRCKKPAGEVGRLLDAFGGATYSQHIARSRGSSTEAPPCRRSSPAPPSSVRPAAGVGAWSGRARAVADHRTPAARHTFHGPPEPADQVVLALSGEISRQRIPDVLSALLAGELAVDSVPPCRSWPSGRCAAPASGRVVASRARLWLSSGPTTRDAAARRTS